MNEMEQITLRKVRQWVLGDRLLAGRQLSRSQSVIQPHKSIIRVGRLRCDQITDCKRLQCMILENRLGDGQPAAGLKHAAKLGKRRGFVGNIGKARPRGHRICRRIANTFESLGRRLNKRALSLQPSVMNSLFEMLKQCRRQINKADLNRWLAFDGPQSDESVTRPNVKQYIPSDQLSASQHTISHLHQLPAQHLMVSLIAPVPLMQQPSRP